MPDIRWNTAIRKEKKKSISHHPVVRTFTHCDVYRNNLPTILTGSAGFHAHRMKNSCKITRVALHALM